MSNAHSLKNSITLFHTEYRYYPHIKARGLGTDLKCKSDKSVMNALLGSGPGSKSLNPRVIVFIKLNPGNLIIDPKGNQSMIDDHGNLYNIIMDTNGDGQIDDPFTGAPVFENVLVWSNGPDGVSGTADDIKSW